MFCIPKILKNESNSQRTATIVELILRCFVSQRYWKMKAIHNVWELWRWKLRVVLYPKDTEKWKQFTTLHNLMYCGRQLFCIPKILKNESNSQPLKITPKIPFSCFVSQRYWKMKAIHNPFCLWQEVLSVVLYPKDTEKWKQFTTKLLVHRLIIQLFCIPKILKNESNSQLL